MKFEGRVQYRSSAKPGVGPPGEAEVLALNPQRRVQILAATGWDSLEPGSLNLTVDNSVIEAMRNRVPLFVEDGNTIHYPDRWQHIPKLRQGYKYYSGSIECQGERRAILVRIAINPLPDRVEIFAPMNLTKELRLRAGDRVSVEL